jgi:hypothetical protein
MAMGAGPPGIGGMDVGRSPVMGRSSIAVSRPAVDWLVTKTAGTPQPAEPTEELPAEPPGELPAGPPSSR